MKLPDELENKRNWWRTLLIVLAVVVIFPLAIQSTEINLEEPLEPRRQQNLFELLRELAQPQIFAYETETRRTAVSIRMPCPEEIRGSQVVFEGRTILLAPNCATTTQDPLTITASGFPAQIHGSIIWYPAGSGTTRNLTEFRADREGNFEVTFTLPDIRETEEPQRLEVVEVLDRNIVGLSDTTIETLELILETILMALMASTLGTILAVPISFIAARNLMNDVKMPLAALMAAIIVVPFGYWLGSTVSTQLSALATAVTSQAIIGIGTLGLSLGLLWPVFRIAPAADGSLDGSSNSLLAGLRVALLLLLSIFSLGIAARLGLVAGDWMRDALGPFGFIGNFIAVLSDLLRVLLPAFVGLISALVAASNASRIGQNSVIAMSKSNGQILTLILTTTGTAVLAFSLFYGLHWICLLDVCSILPESAPQLWLTLGIPALLLGLVAGGLSMRQEPKRPFAIGIITYTLTRSILNGLRSIEPVLLGFVLVVWVGLGPFAGIMALMIASVADLGKLFSEQVENISQGPIEAITATGANRLQTIVFAVIPQIVPHYIAFAFYRWDINVRMATIIGFVGGGGIGFVLFRNANLTQYQAASVQVIAIAIVVTTLDYISSKLRSRIL